MLMYNTNTNRYDPITIAGNSGITTTYGTNGTGLTLKNDTAAIQTVSNFFPKGDSRYAKIASPTFTGSPKAPALILTGITTGTPGTDSILVKKSSDNKIYKIAAGSYATDAAVIHNTGNETVAGQKTWSDNATFNSSVNVGLTTIIGNQVQIANSSNSAHLLSIWGGNGSFGPTYGWTWTDSGTGTSLVATQATSNRTITFPDASGTVALTSDIAAAAANPYSTSATPSIVVNSTIAGSGYTISIAGTNQDGVITLTTGSSPSGVGGFLTVTMSGGFAYTVVR